jgi:hypothetical protein
VFKQLAENLTAKFSLQGSSSRTNPAPDPFVRRECRSLPTLAVAAGSVFLYESFGSKSDRTSGCTAALPGGAWILDPATGQLSGPIVPGVHFNRLVANRSGSMLYGVDPGDAAWGGPVRLVTIDSQDYRVLQSRTFDEGVLQISLGVLRHLPSGEVRMAPPAGR